MAGLNCSSGDKYAHNDIIARLTDDQIASCAKNIRIAIAENAQRIATYKDESP